MEQSTSARVFCALAAFLRERERSLAVAVIADRILRTT